MNVIDRAKPYAKAVVAFVSPGVVSLVAAVQDTSPAGQAVTVPEWIGIGAACILTSGAVYLTPNRTERGYMGGVKDGP